MDTDTDEDEDDEDDKSKLAMSLVSCVWLDLWSCLCACGPHSEHMNGHVALTIGYSQHLSRNSDVRQMAESSLGHTTEQHNFEIDYLKKTNLKLF